MGIEAIEIAINMREIKFRVWDHDLKKFIEDSNADPHICWNGKVYCYERQKEGGDVLVSGIRNLTVQQFTGMVDKDGKEIYEGDIIKYPWLTVPSETWDKETYRIDEVKFVTGCFIPDIWRTVVDDCEVIGNVFEKEKK